MKAIQAFLSELQDRHIKLWVENGELCCKAPKGTLNAQLKAKLSEYKAEITRLLQPTEEQTSIPALPSDQELPLSFAQQRLWFLDQLQGHSATYNAPAILRLSGALDREALQQSLRWLAERHTNLRACFPSQDGQARVEILDLEHFEIPKIHDLRPLTTEVQNQEVQNRVNHHAVEAFDLARGPLFKADLLLLSEQESVLLFNMHHIITDGWSTGVLNRDFQHAYTAFAQRTPPSLPPLEIQYSDYAAWQRSWLQGEVLQEQLDYWQQQLAGIPELLELPTDNPRPAQQSFSGAHYVHRLPLTLSQNLTRLSQQQGVSLFMTLLSAFYILLARYSRQDDICVGSPIANRTHRQIQDLIGFFANTLVLRGRLPAQQSFTELLRETRETCLAAYGHQDIPFEMLVEKLQPTRSLGHSPLFQAMLVLQNHEATELTLPNLAISALIPDGSIAKFDLTLEVQEQPGQLHCKWEYATDLFNAATIERMAAHFEVLLTAAVANPAQPINQLPMLTEAEIGQLQIWNDTAIDYPADKTVVDLFEQQVKETPNNIALIFKDEQLTYQQLNQKANQLAHHLTQLMSQAKISTHNPLIAIAVERSLEMVIGLLGILKMGGAYVPIDPSYPVARIQYMLMDSAAPLLLTQSQLKAQLPLAELEHDCGVMCLDEVAFDSQPTKSPDVNRRTTDLAYVIYTSGSTGKPKGVMVEHEGLVNLALAQIDTFRIVPESRVLQFASFSFDASISEITTTLLTGAHLHLVPKATLLDSTSFNELMVKQQISHITLPPSFLSALPKQALSSLQTLVVAGEVCSTELMKQWANQVHFINAYGPTESTVCASMAVCFADMDVSHIGKPLANTRLYILGVQHQPQPIGIPGELCIAGVGIARGYLNRPELTAEKFIEVELFGKTERVYQTGDLARWRPDGNLEYLGRLDHQVKLRGFRIELGEIESVLNKHPSINESVVVHNPEQNSLNAYLTEAKRVELWPSIAEFYVYDDIVYHSMAMHESRNQQYLAAFQQVLSGKTVVEIGTGPEVILSRLALQAGAKKIYAIELLEETYRKAQDTLKRLGLSDKIMLIQGDATVVTLPEPVDYCISEIVGSIGGAEGAAVIINNARRFLKEGSHMIPQRSITKIAAVSLPESLFDYGFADIAAHYTQKIFAQVGYHFDLRLCVKNLPLTQIISNSDVFEDLDYRYPINLETSHEICFQFNQDSEFTGFLVWLTLYTDQDHIIDIITEQHSWLPIYLPLFTDRETVKTGDKLVATLTRQLCDNQFNPDYLIEGMLYRQGQPDLPIHCHSYHFKSEYHAQPFYQKLFADDIVPVLPKLKTETLKDYLSEYLPDYMLPSHFNVLDTLPLTPNGKIDRKVLPVPDATLHQAAIFVKPQTTLERQIAEVWQALLKLEKVGIYDNFFDLGGHSLLLMQVQSRLQALLDEPLPVVKLFQYPTIHSLATHLTQHEPASSVKSTSVEATYGDTDDIAIIGMAGRFPGANDIDVFWNNLREGVESIQFFSDEELLNNGVEPMLIKHPDYVKAHGALEDVELFDAHFFNYTPREADFLDPQQRLFLQIAWASLEYAGYDVADIDFRVGVFAGAGTNSYLINNLLPNRARLEILSDFEALLADRDFIATSTAYKLNLTGPALFIHTACSTSLVAVHVARQSLLNNECEMALAGGVSVGFPHKQGYLYQKGMIASPDGHCRAFDAAAQGSVGGAGVGVVVLKRLSRAVADGDTIHAVIKGSAINNDGMNKVGFTAPSVNGQTTVITEAMRGIDYDSISYIEAHGTATILGDPIEVSALTQAYRSQTDKTGYCALGSVKTNIGHLDTAAGVAGLIKTVLALKHREIPPSLHFQQPNPQIDFANSPFFVNNELKAWESSTPRCAGVSSFGIGGTNAHVVLEEAPAPTSSPATRPQLICLSGKTEQALLQAKANLADYLTEHPKLNLADVAYTLHQGRKDFSHRGFLVYRPSSESSQSEVAEMLHEQNPLTWRQSQTEDKTAKIVFMFSGQGTQYVKMAWGLYQVEPVFQHTVDECAELLKPLMGQDIRNLLYPAGDEQPDLKPSRIAQPLLFVIEYALAKLCITWGLEPTAMIGHSIGEYVAACLAEVFSLPDALQLIAVRSQLMDDLSSGEMLSVLLPKNEVEALLSEGLFLSAHNAPNLSVVSGSVAAISDFMKKLQSQRIMHSRLYTANAAHSPLMVPLMASLREHLSKISLNPPKRPYIANLTGTWITAAQAISVDYWCDHLLNTVLFSEGIQTLLEQDDYILLELGPEMSLTSFALQHQPQYTVNAFNLLRTAVTAQDDYEWLLNILGQMWLKGVKVDWAAFYANEQRLRIPLPTYPFARQRHWIEPIPSTSAMPAHTAWQQRLPVQQTEEVNESESLPNTIETSWHQRPALTTQYTAPRSLTEQKLVDIWQHLFGFEPIGIYDNFFELGGHSLLGIQFLSRLRESFHLEATLDIVFEHPVLKKFAHWLDQQQHQYDTQLPPITPLAEGEPLVLSYAQQRLWFLAQLEGPSATYNLPSSIRLSGHLDVDAFQQSLRWLIERHTSLRSYFPSQNGQPYMQILNLEDIDVLKIHDLRHLTPEVQSQTVQTLANQHKIERFDLTQGPLFKSDLLLLGEQKFVWLFNMQHTICDGWSIGVFNRELQHAYTAFVQGTQPSLPPREIQYSDYAAWQRAWLQGEVLQQQLAYWQQQLAGIPELLELPTDKPRPPQQSYQGTQYVHSLSPTLSSHLTSLSRQQGVSMVMVILSALYILLARYSRQNDICVGSHIANRSHSQIEDLIGFFVNTVVLRGQLQPQQTFTDLLQETRKTFQAAYAHQDIPYDIVVEQLQPTRSLSYNPLFQVVLAVINNLPDELNLPGLDISLVGDFVFPITKFDLGLYIKERNGQWHCGWEYATDLFVAETIERMAKHFETLLTSIVNNPRQAISQLSLLTESEIQQLQAWNDTATAYPADKTIVDLFEQQVANIPDNIAVVFEDEPLTYQQLNTQANQLAHHLLALMSQAEISAKNPLIAIAVERSLEMMIGLLGILKAGGAYVPIDPNYPATRFQYMLEDSEAPLLLTQSHLKTQLPLNELKHVCEVVCLDEATFASQSMENPDVKHRVEDLAYVIYTSGSTGKPKGVMVEHRNVVNHLDGFEKQAPHVKPLSGIFTVPFSFDLSVWEIFNQLCYGGTLHILSPEYLLETDLLTDYLLDKQVSSAYIPPSLLEPVANALLKRGNPLQRLLVGVEPIPQKILQAFRTLSDELYIINGYGPTEATVCATFYKFTHAVDGERRTPIGKPSTNYQVYVLDADNNPQLPGIQGELCIAGTGLARGYLNRPELTAGKFVEIEIFGKTERIYKTGDLARWLPDGNLEYLGRLDHQVKLRGFRIELGEIESVLTQHQAVKEAVVNLYETDTDKRLVAYLTTDSAMPDDLIIELKNWLKAQLPDYMIPSHFTVLEKLPLTPNSKIDRNALPAPDTLLIGKHYQLPRDQVELQLVQIWENLLGVSPINIRESFFELGGHSLSAVHLMAQIEQQFNQHLPLTTLFQNATIEQLAIVLRQQPDALPWSPLVPIQTQGEKWPLFCVHPAGGNVLCYFELAQMLGIEQPCYGLQTFGLEAGQTPYTQVTDMATFYLNALKTIQPQGPYQLAGWSFGGLVAFEMARQLQAQGESVAQLALLDTVTPSIIKEHHKPQDDAQLLAVLFQEEGISLSLEHLRQLTPDEQLSYTIEKAKQTGVFPPDMELTQAKRFWQVYKINTEAARSYQPQLYHGQITLFQVTEKSESMLIEEADYGWQAYTTEGIEIVQVPGAHHNNLTKSPHVQTLAEQLKLCLNLN